MPTVEDIKRIAEIEFVDIIKDTSQIDYKLRIFLVNNSFIDVYLSQRLPDKFGFHWECRDEKGTLYRYDNFPDKNWQRVETFPYHCHNGSHDSVETSLFPLSPIEGFRAFMEFARNKLKEL
jgi:hypothetical protein